MVEIERTLSGNIDLFENVLHSPIDQDLVDSSSQNLKFGTGTKEQNLIPRDGTVQNHGTYARYKTHVNRGRF